VLFIDVLADFGDSISRKRKVEYLSYNVRHLIIYTASFLEKIKRKTAALILQKPPRQKGRVKISLLYDGFFSFAVVRQILL
jgi:hypothetical protein